MKIKKLLALIVAFLMVAMIAIPLQSNHRASGFDDHELIISEYVEGSSNNKALEIYNGTSGTIDLSNYKINIFANGHTTPDNTITFSNVSLNPGDTYVIVNSSANSDLKSKADLLSNKVSFNGDDAVALDRSDGTHVDVIGKIGQDPGKFWGSGSCTTKDHTLVRKPLILRGDSDGSDDFDPSVQWNCFPEDTFDHLGWHIEVTPSPHDGATGVPTNTNVTATFNRSMDSTTITTSTFVLKDPSGNEVPGSVSYDDTNHVATFTPNSPLNSNTTYTASLSETIKDSDGHELGAGAVWSFTTTSSTPGGPSVTSTVPSDGAADVSVDTTISATFDRDMDSSTINTSTFTVKDSSGNQVSGSVSYDSNTKTAVFTPSSNLSNGVQYTATISGTVKDTNGNAMGSDYSWSFTTKSQVTPLSVETDDATNVTSNSATLNGKLTGMGNNSSVTVYFKYSTDGTNWTETSHQTLNAVGSFSANISNLLSGTTYKFVAVAEGSSGNPVSGAEKTFTTTVSGNPVVLFDNTKDETAGNADWTIDGAYSDWADALRNAGYTVESLNSGTITSTVLQNVTVFILPEPQDPLSSDEIAAIEDFVNNGGGLIYIADHSGSDRNNNGHDSPHIFNESFENAGVAVFGFEFNLDNFSQHPITNVNHTIYPELTDGVNSIGEWGASTINIKNTDIAKGVITNDEGKIVLVGAEVGAGRVAAIGDSSPFDDGTADPDNQGDHLYDGWSEYDDATLALDMVKWCAAAKLESPKVVSVFPTNGATNVPINVTITATFNKSMDENSIKAPGAFTVKDSSGNEIDGNVTFDNTNNTAKFVPSNSLAHGETYTVTISKNVKDLAGNTLGEDYTWSFSTEEVVLPKIIETVPPDGATDVPINTLILAVFSKPMKTSGGSSTFINSSTFTVKDSNGNPVNGTIQYNTNYNYNGTPLTNVAIFTPSQPLQGNTQYTATIAGTVEDTDGNSLGADYSWSFTTVMPILPIATVRGMSIGSQVYIEGVVTLPTGILFGNNKKEFYIQDSTGGIAVYYKNGGLPDLDLGYVVRVKGTLSKYGVLEVKPSSLDDVEVVDTTGTVPPPIPITVDLVPSNAGKLVITKGTVQGNVIVKHSYSYFMLSDSTGASVKVFVDKDTHIDLSDVANGKEVTVEGIAEVYVSHGNSIPEIIVRFQSDINCLGTPLPPRDLRATLVAGGVQLKWKAPASMNVPITGYAIYRSLSSGNANKQLIAKVNYGHNYYFDKGAKEGNTYYYYVKSYYVITGYGNPFTIYSDSSNEVSITLKKTKKTRDNTPPKIEKIEIANAINKMLNTSLADLMVYAVDNTSEIAKVTVKVNGRVVRTLYGNVTTMRNIPLDEGMNKVEVFVYDVWGNVGEKTVNLICDTKPPVVDMHPIPSVVTSSNLKIVGSVVDSTTGVLSATINGRRITLTNGRKFAVDLKLHPGKNEIVLKFVDRAGNTELKKFIVNYTPERNRNLPVITLQIGNPYITVNGTKHKIDKEGSKPIIKNNRTLLPIRSFIESLGGTVEWNPTTREVTINLNGNTIILTIGKNTALVNGIKTPIDPNNPDVTPIIINGRTYLPLRFIAEHLNCSIQWNPATKTITVYYWG